MNLCQRKMRKCLAQLLRAGIAGEHFLDEVNHLHPRSVDARDALIIDLYVIVRRDRHKQNDYINFLDQLPDRTLDIDPCLRANHNHT